MYTRFVHTKTTPLYPQLMDCTCSLSRRRLSYPLPRLNPWTVLRTVLSPLVSQDCYGLENPRYQFCVTRMKFTRRRLPRAPAASRVTVQAPADGFCDTSDAVVHGYIDDSPRSGSWESTNFASCHPPDSRPLSCVPATARENLESCFSPSLIRFLCLAGGSE